MLASALAAAISCVAIALTFGAGATAAAILLAGLTALVVRNASPHRRPPIEAAVDHLADGFVTLDTRWRFTWVNARSAAYAGTPAEALLGRPVWDIVPGLLGTTVAQRLRDAMTSRQTDAFEVCDERTGRWFELHLHPVPDGLAIYAREVTERHRWEDTLRESEARFRTLADSAPVLIWVTGPDGGPEFLNRTYREFTGQAHTSSTEMWRALLHPEDATTLADLHQRARASGMPFEAQFRFRRHDGQWRWLKAVGLPRRDERGTFLGYVGSSLDITEMKQAEAAALEADRRKDDFLAILAHELRNPLGPIRNAVEVLVAESPADSRLDHARGIVMRQVVQMGRLIDDLLDVSRIARDKIELRRTWVDLRTLVREVVEDVRPLVEQKAQMLTVNVPDVPLVVDGDGARLRQVVANLLGNAVKFTPSRGHIGLAVEADAGDVRVRIRDTGPGIPAEVLPRIFEPFVQGDANRRHGGLGIGLTLVRRLVEMHGGRVDARSAGASCGSEFTVTLPLLPPSLPLAKAVHSGVPVSARRVLVVEDDADSAESLVMLLEAEGHVVRAARDGREAVEAAGSFRPDVALVDIGLPGIDGYEVARRLRHEPACAQTTLVALSGYGQDDDKRRARDAGFDHHLLKPADLDALHAILGREPSPTLH